MPRWVSQRDRYQSALASSIALCLLKEQRLVHHLPVASTPNCLIFGDSLHLPRGVRNMSQRRSQSKTEKALGLRRVLLVVPDPRIH